VHCWTSVQNGAVATEVKVVESAEMPSQPLKPLSRVNQDLILGGLKENEPSETITRRSDEVETKSSVIRVSYAEQTSEVKNGQGEGS